VIAVDVISGAEETLPSRDPDASRVWFEEAIVALLPDLYATGLRLTRHRTDAEDLVAEAVAKAWLGLGVLRDRSSFRGWVFRILTNQFLSLCRARALRCETELPDDAAEDAAQFSLFERLHQPFLLWGGNPEREFLDRLVREDLERAVAALPEVYRVVVVLTDLEGLCYHEVAAGLGIPIGTVRSRLARGRALLQQALWRHAADAGLVRGPEGKGAAS